MNYNTLEVGFQDKICHVRISRPEANNTINDLLIEEMRDVLAICEASATIVVLKGLPEVFCFGADFESLLMTQAKAPATDARPEALYDLWLKFATGPYITVSYVRGKANAGGIGFVAASDIVLADRTAQFSLSELLFGLFPACVLPFLINRIGYQKAHYMTLMTKPIPVEKAGEWGLVDAYEDTQGALLRMHLLRLRRLSKIAITRYKRYMSKIHDHMVQSRPTAVAANREIFSDADNLEGINRYVEKGQFPWEVK